MVANQRLEGMAIANTTSGGIVKMKSMEMIGNGCFQTSRRGVFGLLVIISSIFACQGGSGGDDWRYNPKIGDQDGSFGGTGPNSANTGNPAADEGIGLATGGAKDISNFRENIANDYLPFRTDITFEGMFYEYYFDTDLEGECDVLFCPSYSAMVATDPLSEAHEAYLSVGLNSGIKASDFSRKQHLIWWSFSTFGIYGKLLQLVLL